MEQATTKTKMSLGFKASVALNAVLLALIGLGVWAASSMSTKFTEAQTQRHDRFTAEMLSASNASSLESVDIVFIGDSITAAGLWQEYFPDHVVANRGVRSDQTHDILERIDGIVGLEPKRLFLMVGVNDLNFGKSAAETIADYERLLDAFEARMPESEIMVQSILPVSADYIVPGVNDAAKIVNEHLADSSARRGHTFVNVRELFETSDGSLDERFTSDGIHLAGDAYVQWRDYVAPYVRAE